MIGSIQKEYFDGGIWYIWRYDPSSKLTITEQIEQNTKEDPSFVKVRHERICNLRRFVQ